MCKAKIGQAQERENHLTELLDGLPDRSYSEVTLQPGRTPGSGLQGAYRDSGRRNRETSGPQTRCSRSRRDGAPLEKAPRAAAGGLLIFTLRPAGLTGAASGV